MDSEKLNEVRKKSKFSTQFSAASIIYCDQHGNDPVISQARYFADDVIKCENLIENKRLIDNPLGEGKICVIFYGDEATAKTCVKILNPKDPVSKTTLKSRANRIMTDGMTMPGSSRNLRSNDETNHSLEEINSTLRSIRRELELQDLVIRNIRIKSDEHEERLAALEEMKDDIDDEKNVKTNLRIAEKASTIIQSKRLSKKFRVKVKAWSHPDLSKVQLEDIKEALLSGTNVVSKISIKLAQIIFGTDVLKRCILGIKGEFTRKPRKSERNEIIPIDKENILRGKIPCHDHVVIYNFFYYDLDVFKLFDENLFTDNDGWNLLVRGPINQKGREITSENERKRTKARDDDDRKRRKISEEEVEVTSDKNSDNEQNLFDAQTLSPHASPTTEPDE